MQLTLQLPKFRRVSLLKEYSAFAPLPSSLHLPCDFYHNHITQEKLPLLFCNGILSFAQVLPMSTKVRKKSITWPSRTEHYRHPTSTACQQSPSFVSPSHCTFHDYKKSRYGHTVRPVSQSTAFIKAASNYQQKNKVMWNRVQPVN